MTDIPPPEDIADALLSAAYSGPAAIFGDDAASESMLEARKIAAELLVSGKMAKYADDGRTEIVLTNAGRYWTTHGGLSAFMREEPAGSGGGRGRNPEMEALRFNYMRLRMSTFWWSFGLSVASFAISIISLVVAGVFGKNLLAGWG